MGGHQCLFVQPGMVVAFLTLRRRHRRSHDHGGTKIIAVGPPGWVTEERLLRAG
jgi:hypothetical protein